MPVARSLRVPIVMFGLFALLIAVAGCGGAGPVEVEMVSVSGIVTYEDGTFPTASNRWISFEPVERMQGLDNPKKSARAQIDEKTGQFVMSTVRNGDGVIVGKYKVVFIIYDEREDGTKVPMVAEEFSKAQTTPIGEIDVTEAAEELKYTIRKP